MKKEANERTQIITRKYNIVPCKSYSKEWYKRCYEYTLENQRVKREKAEHVLNDKKKNIENRDKLEAAIQRYEDNIRDMEANKDDYDFTNQMVYDYTANLCREAMESESRRKNYILSWAFSEMIRNGLQHEKDFKVRNKFIGEMLKPAYRIKGSNKGSLFDDAEIESILCGYGNSFSQELTRIIKDAVNKGLLEGKVTLPTFKMNSPFTVAKDTMGFSSSDDGKEIDKDSKLYFDFGGYNRNKGAVTPTLARFEFNLGGAKNRDELLSTLSRVYSGEYTPCGSSIQFDRKGRKIMLNLTLEIPVKDNALDEKTIVEVNLGKEIPAICTLNNGDATLEIGSKEYLLKMRTQQQAQRRSLQKSLTITNGGHGRKKKLRKLNELNYKEANFVKTYLHKVSKQAVEFAVKNQAKYIHLKNIEEYDSKDYILKNMSYYKLCEQIKYKAAMQGITVKVDN